MFSNILRRNQPFLNNNMKEYLRKQHDSYTQRLLEKEKRVNLLIDKSIKKHVIWKDVREEELSADKFTNYNCVVPNNQVLQIYRIPFLAFWGFAMYPLYLYFRYKKMSLFD